MKPKLKVGDYVEVILDCPMKGWIYKIESVNTSSSFPYRLKDGLWSWRDIELLKVNPKFAKMAALSDHEQYRLSLEIYRDLLKTFENFDYFQVFEGLNTINQEMKIDSACYLILTEIL